MIDIFISAIKAILTNKVRAFLTTLGIIIGVSSVVLLMSIGTGLQAYVTDQFASLGSNALFVVPGNPFGEGGGFGNRDQAIIERTKPTLKRTYLKNVIRNTRETVRSGTATAVTAAEAKYQTVIKKVTVYATTETYETVRNTKAEKGRWFTKSEEERAARVALLGPEAATEIFGEIDPVNKTLILSGQEYKVLGVLESKGGGFGGPNFDNYVYVPLETAQKSLNVELIDSFIFEVRSQEQIEQAKKEIEAVMEKYIDEEEFTVFDQSQLLTTINSILGTLTAGLGGIAAISLLVGGIGIMNIMLVSVTERTREIGLRKALGATPNIILLQFLIEAAVLSFLGGMVGVGLAYAGTLAIQGFFPAKITSMAVILAFSVSTLVGLIFGAAPARRAAKLSPIEALRYE